MVENSRIHLPFSSPNSAGSIWFQIAAASSAAVAPTRTVDVARDRDFEAQRKSVEQAVACVHHQLVHPAATASAPTKRRGIRHAATSWRAPRTPTPAPSATKASGNAQQEEARIAPIPAANPTAPNHLAPPTGDGGDIPVEVKPLETLLIVIARSRPLLKLYCIL